MTETGARMGFFEHLEELRSRLMRTVLALVVMFGVFIPFGDQMYKFIARPLIRFLPEGAQMVFINPVAPFFTYLKVSFVAALLVCVPYILYELWRFIAPGLYSQEKKLAMPFVAIATLLFYVGVCFAYYIVFPVVFRFFVVTVPHPDIKPMIEIREYVALVMRLGLAFGAVFETPIVIVFLGLLGLVDTAFLRKGRRYFIVVAFLIGAILSPPDIVSQIFIAGPLLALYEVSIRVLGVIERRREKRAEELDNI
jgi:sec-independent protein translocase protein TatC